jgi:hypothetical protein
MDTKTIPYLQMCNWGNKWDWWNKPEFKHFSCITNVYILTRIPNNDWLYKHTADCKQTGEEK